MCPQRHHKTLLCFPISRAKRSFALLRSLVWRSGLEFNSLVPDQAYYYYIKEHLEGQRFDWIVGAVQLLTESLLREWTAEAVRQTSIRHVVLSGGIFLNVKANLCISLLPEVETLAICPSPGDDSTAIGAAYWGYEQECLHRNIPFEPQPLENLYLGPEYSETEMEQSIERFRQQELTCSVERSERIELKNSNANEEHTYLLSATTTEALHTWFLLSLLVFFAQF